VNTTPTITGATITRQQGSPVSNSQIATVADPDQSLNTLMVTATPSTGTGVTVSNITVNAGGQVFADVVASCTATNSTFTLTVTDNQSATAMATLTVNITANTAPTLGNYPNTGPITVGGGTMVTPDAVPSDNGLVTSLTASAPGFTGTFSGDPATGKLTISNAGPAGAFTVTVTATDNCGATSTTTFTLTVNTPPSITAIANTRQQGSPAMNSNIATVSDPDQSSGSLVVTFSDGSTSKTVNGVMVSSLTNTSGTIGASIVASCTATDASFTLKVADNLGATATATLNVTVTANTPPTLGAYPSAGTINLGTGATVTPNAAPSDNGSISSITASAPLFTGSFSVNPATGVVTISNAVPAGSYTVTVTAIDNCGATASQSFSLVVNGPPTIAGQTITRQQGAAGTVSTIALVSDDLAAAGSLSVTVTSVPAGITVGPLTNTNGTITANVAAACNATIGNNTVGLQVTDGSGLMATANLTVSVTANPAPVVTITGPVSGSIYAVGTPVNFTGTFTDNAGDTHTASWMFDSTTQSATVVEPSGSTPGSANTTYTFTQAGVYTVKLTVTDGCGLSGTATTVGEFDAMVVIYDPSAGWVTGGGWIDSPAGAYVPNPTLTGKANFGFVSKYQNGASVPTGNTEFYFKAGDLKFKSTSYEWMVIAGKKVQYKGFGTINGSGSYRFMLTAIDGDQPGGGGQDKFRIKIWSDGGGLVYDNQMNDPDSNDPTTVLGGGSIVIHKP
jgi:hypothetical protein